MSDALLWSVAAGAIAGVLFRPREWPEAVWPCLGAAVLLAAGVLRVREACRAVVEGRDVYLFLTGMMLLAELARRQGVFDWLAGVAVAASQGSRPRLFCLVYAAGVLVTVFLSNDATAIVLTPAVYAAVRKFRGDPLPYLFACAFIANAASFVLPISNPANLVVYGKSLPPLWDWLRTFLAPSACSIGATYVALRYVFRRTLAVPGSAGNARSAPALSREGRWAAWGILAAGAVLLGASALGIDLGLPTCAAAVPAVLIATGARPRAVREIAAGVSWNVLPLVAGLFVLVEALRGAGALAGAGHMLQACAAMPRFAGSIAASTGAAALSNLANNLPAGLLAGRALQVVHAPGQIRDAALIGIDLGPNLSITGSLATLLWLSALRREGQQITGWQFLKVGALVMPSALLAACLSLLAAPH
jgi:arsenical pump membrane protein